MPAAAPTDKPRFFATPSKLRAWFEANHEKKTELVVGFYRKGSGQPSITWPEAVDEALCFGWIDGVRRSLGDEAYAIRFTPRKPTSLWSNANVRRVASLTRLGRMTPAGLRAFAARKDAKTGIYSFERKRPAKLSPEQDEALRANPKAAAFFDAQAPWYRRTAIHWIASAKREATKARRLAQLIADSAAQRRLEGFTSPGTKQKRAP